MTHGGGGFQTSDDGVVGHVSIDIPTEGIQSLKQISEGIDRFRTATEAAARGSATFIGYLNQMVQAGNMATEAHRNLAAQLERTSDVQQRMQTGSTSSASQLPLSRSAPQGYTDNFAGMGAGMGGQRPSTTPTGEQMQQTIDSTQAIDPRKYLSAQAGRNRLVPGELTGQAPGATNWGDQADRVEQRDRVARAQAQTTPASPGGDPDSPGWQGQVAKYSGLAGNIMNEMGPGRGFGGIGNMAVGGMTALGGYLGRRMSAAAPQGAGVAEEQAEKAAGGSDGKGSMLGMLGGLARSLPVVGGALGAGLGALGLVEMGGSKIQGLRNMGMIQGGAAGQGLGDQMRISAMALDPFLTTEQARQVVMAGLTEGYHGQAFDSVTKFLSSNLKDMNLSVSDSVKLLRTNVAEGGESIGDLNKQLHGLKDIAKNSTMSQPDLQKSFAETSHALIAGGVPGKEAGEIATGAAKMWDSESMRGLKGMGGPLVQSMMSMQGGAAMMAYGGVRGAAGVLPNELITFISQHQGPGAVLDDIKKTLTNMIRQRFTGAAAEKNSKAYDNALSIFTYQVIPTFFQGFDVDQSQVKLMVDNVIDGKDILNPDKKDDTQARTTSAAAPTAPVIPPGGIPGQNGPQGFSTSAGAHQIPGSSPNANAMFQSVVNAYGKGGTQVVDSKGNASPMTGSKEQIAGLESGALQWRRTNEGGPGNSLSSSGGGGSATHVTFAPAVVTIKVDPQTGKVTQSPNVIQLSPNAQQVNAGVGSSTMNNPQPGDGYGYNYTGTGTRE
jgi:hypothetical protein